MRVYTYNAMDFLRALESEAAITRNLSRTMEEFGATVTTVVLGYIIIARRAAFAVCSA